jgi:sugar phosphate isomerase/epimerase
MKASLSTMWWAESTATIPALCRRTREMGFEQIELNYRLPAQDLPELRWALDKSGLAVSSVHAPFPRPDGGNPLSQADLAAENAADRKRAEALVVQSMEEAVRWGTQVIVLHAGDIQSLRPLELQLQTLYQDDVQSCSQLRETLCHQRAAQAPRHLEWVRQGLTRLVPRAQTLGLTIGLENRAGFRDLPSQEEMGLLLQEFSPTVKYWHDVGHAFRQETLGFASQESWLQKYGSHLMGFHWHDCVGMSDHRPPGQGETPFEKLLPYAPPNAIHVFEIHWGYQDREIAAGLAFLRSKGLGG